MSDQIVFTVSLRPVSANHLYPGKAHRYPSMDGLLFKQRIHEAALSAADRFGWDLMYDGPARVDIIDYRTDPNVKPKRAGVDWDSIPKAIQDALCPPAGQIMLNDREAWSGHVYIVIDPNPRITVIVRKTTRAAIAADVTRLLAEVASVV